MSKKGRLLLLKMFMFATLLNLKLFAQGTDTVTPKLEPFFPLVDNLFSRYAADHHFPAQVFGLVVNGRLVHTGQTGYTDLAARLTAGSSAEFRIASMTKSFTAMAVLRLRDQGRLRLDDPVSDYIPEMKDQHYLTADAAPVTIRHLLTHGAGFPEDNPWGDRQLAKTDADMLAMIKKGIVFSRDPGMGYEYSNMGFAMLGYIIKKVSGQSYQTYITQNILQPLGMTHTYWEYGKVPAEQLARGYRWLNNGWVEQPLLHDGTYGAMGGMITSIEDFSKWVSLHLAAWPPRDDADNGPVKRSSIREMQMPWNISGFSPQYAYPTGRACPLFTAYGYGLRWSQDCTNRVSVSHTGGLPGFGSNWLIFPAYGIGIISFSNLTYAPEALINLAVLDTLVTLARLQPRSLPASAILEQRKNELVRLLPGWKEPAATGIFAENFLLDYFPDELRREAAALFAKAGRIVHVGNMIPENNLRGSCILQGEHADLELSFTLTPENPPLIQEYHLREKPKNR